MPEFANRIARSLSDKLGEQPSALDFIPEAQHAAVRAGTASANLTSAIQNGLNAVAGAGGGVLYLPWGVYPVMDLTVPPNVFLQGDGAARTILKRTGNLPAGRGVLNFAGAKSGCGELAIDGQVTTPATALYSSLSDPSSSTLVANSSIRIHPGASDITLYRCRIFHTGGYAVHIDARTANVYRVEIIEPHLHDNRSFLFGATAGSEIYGSWTGGILAQGDGLTNNYGVRGLTVRDGRFRRGTGNQVWSHLYGFGTLHTDFRIQGCTFEDIGRDGIMLGGVVGGDVAGNFFRRIGYICTDDVSAGVPRWINGQWAVGLDTAGLTRGVSYRGNSFVSCYGAAMDLDGFAEGVVSDNTVIVPAVGEPEYTEDAIASWAGNYCYGAQTSNTNNLAEAAVGVRVTGNRFRNCGLGAVRMYASRRGAVSGNTIEHPAGATVAPIVLGNIGSGANQRAYANTVTDNDIHYSPAAITASVQEDPNGFAFSGSDINRVYGNRLHGTNTFEFLRAATSGSRTAREFASNKSGLAAESKTTLQREDGYLRAYWTNGSVTKSVLSLLDQAALSGGGSGGPLLNISLDAVGGVIATGARTSSAFDDAVLSSKFYADGFLAVAATTFAAAEANLLADSVGLIRYNATTKAFEQSTLASAGARVWTPFEPSRWSVLGADIYRSSGRVTLGSSIPASLLTLRASTDDGLTITNNTQTGVYFVSSYGGPTIGSTSTHPLVFLTNNAARGRITDAGNWLVGANTDDASGARLQIGGFARATVGFATPSTNTDAIQATVGGVTARFLIGTRSLTLVGDTAANAGVSGLGQGRIYFDSTANRFRISENGGAFQDLTGAGVTSLAGTANQVNVSAATGAVTLSLPQNIHAGASPTFAGLTVSNNSGATVGGVSGVMSVVDGSVPAGSPRFMVRNTSGTSNGATIELNGPTAKWAIGQDFNQNGGNNLFVYDRIADAMRLYVDSSGFVGLGTPNPRRRLDVFGGGVCITDPGGANRTIHWGDSATGVFPIGINGNATSGQCYLAFSTNTFGSNFTEQMRITSSGNVLVATASDDGSGARLQVNSFVRAITGFATPSANTDAIQAPSGGVTARFLIGTRSLTLTADTVANAGLSAAGQGRIYYDATANKFRVSENGGAYVDLASGNYWRQNAWSQTNADEWPTYLFIASSGPTWEDGFIKGASTRSQLGAVNAIWGPHLGSGNSFGIFSSGWDNLFEVRAGSGNARIKGSVSVGGSGNPAVLGVLGGATQATSLATSRSLAATSIQTLNTSGWLLTTFMSGNAPSMQVVDQAGTSAGNLHVMPYGGNVLIGTTAQVNYLNGLQISKGAADPQAEAGSLLLTGTTSNHRLAMGYSSNYSAAWIQSVLTGVAGTALLLNPLGGNVGIGTLAAQAALDVATGGLHVRGVQYATSGSAVEIQKISSAIGSISMISNGSTRALGDMRVYGSPVSLWPGGLQALTATAAGNIGIGTPDPSGKLHIAGTPLSLNAVYQDGADRPSLGLTGHYPQLVLMSQVGNSSHGPTIMLGSKNSGDNNNKHWSIGTSGQDSTFLDIGYHSGADFNPHSGIRNYNGLTCLTLLSSGNVLVATTSDDGSGAKLQVNSFVRAASGFATPSANTDAIQAPTGGVTARFLIGTRSLTLTADSATNAGLSAAGQGRIYFDSGANKFRISENGGAFQDLTGVGVTSLTGTANQVNVSAATGAITLSLPQNLHTGAQPTFDGLTISGWAYIRGGSAGGGAQTHLPWTGDLRNYVRGTTVLGDTGGNVLVATSADDGSGARLQVNGFARAITGFATPSSATDAIQATAGGVTARFLIGTRSLTLTSDTAANAGLSSAGQGRIFYDSGTNKFRVSENGGAYVDLASGNYWRQSAWSLTNADEWPTYVFARDGSANWDEGIIKGGSNRSKLGAVNAIWGPHLGANNSFGVFSSGWDNLFEVRGGSGNVSIKGNLGVGTATSPGLRLHVGGTGTAGQINILESLWNTESSYTAGSGSALMFQYGGGHAQALVCGVLETTGSGNNGYLSFHTTTNGGSTFPERARITAAGNFGIGSPSAVYNRLHVAGGSLSVNPANTGEHHAVGGISIVHGGASFPNRALQIYPANDNNPGFAIQAARASGNWFWWTYGVNTDNSFRMARGADAVTGNDFVITSGGNVGIGTANPTASSANTARLEVVGSTRTTFLHGQNALFILPAANNGAANGDAGLYLWISEPWISWTGAGLGRNITNGPSLPRVNPSLSGQMMRFDEGTGILFASESVTGNRYYPLAMVEDRVLVATQSDNGSGAKLQVAGGVTGAAFNATAAGGAIAFQTSNSNFQVDGSGNISGSGSANLAQGFRIGGVSVLDSSRNALNLASATASGVFQSQASGGNVAFQTTNFAFQVDGNGNISGSGSANLSQGFRVGGTFVIDSSRNATNLASATAAGVFQSQASGGNIAFQTTNFNFQVNGNGVVSSAGGINVSGVTCINTSRQFVGYGVDVSFYGVSAGGYNVFGGYVGQTWNVSGSFTINGASYSTLVFRGGILVSAF